MTQPHFVVNRRKESRLATLEDFDLQALRGQPLSREPFEFVVVPEFVRREALARINADYPKIPQRGSFPVPRCLWTSLRQDA